MMRKVSFTILFFFFAVSVHAATIYEVPQDKGWFRNFLEKIWECKWKLSCYGESKLGATITTINATDRISDSRSTINTNFANLNADVLGTLQPARLTATSTSASSTIQWGLEVYDRSIAVGSTATTTIRGNATSSFSNGISTTATLDVQSTSATSTFANGISLARGCILNPAGTCLSPLDLSANNIWTGASTTFVNGVSIGNATSSNATTTNLQISSHASSSIATIGALGVGISTSTQRNLQVAGDVQISGRCSGPCGTRLLGVGAGTTISGANSANLVTVTVPANAMDVDSIIEVTGIASATSTNPNVRFEIGGVFGDQELGTTTSFVGVQKGAGVFLVSIFNNNSASSQQVTSALSMPTSTTLVSSLTVNTANAQSLTISAAANDAGATFNLRNVAVKLFQ